LTSQTSVEEICLRAVSRAAKIHIGLEIEGQESPLTGGWLNWPQKTRMTRNLEKRLLPPQKSSGTLLAAMAWLQSGMGCLKPSSQNKVKQSARKNCCILQ
jgi:hypothetical protein